MFKKLKTKWGVGLLRLIIILCVFATGGSLAGFAARKIMAQTSVEHPVAWTVLYIAVVTICWPVAVLLVSIPFGQLSFFRHYIARMGQRLFKRSPKIKEPVDSQSQLVENQSDAINLAIFASGAGSNARKIIDHFSGHPRIRVALVVCNKPGAGVTAIAAEKGIPVLLIEKERFFRGDAYLADLQQYKINFIILAGFLWKVPGALIARYPQGIINIHPALLPKYGGKGMYGHFVHEAVIAAGETESGITIHFVDEQYDHGATIYQGRCTIIPGDTADTLAARIHQLEHEAYPAIIEKTVLGTS